MSHPQSLEKMEREKGGGGGEGTRRQLLLKKKKIMSKIPNHYHRIKHLKGRVLP
jgi:hypothetical protein